MDDEDQDLLDGDGDTDTGSDEDGGDAGDDAPPADQRKKADAKESKRINDLMGKWQAAEARAKAAEAKLKQAGTSEGTDGGATVPPEVQAWMDVAKEAARERFYNADPRFAEYGLDQTVIEGDDPAAMQASAKRWKELVDTIESKARARVLEEHGINPGYQGSTPEPKRDFGAMSDEEFEREVRKHSAGYL